MALAAKDSCPITLTANTGPISNAQPTQVTAPVDKLINRTGVPIWVDAIRFVITQVGAVGSVQGLVLKARIFLGQHQLTDNFIHLALMCRVGDFTKEAFPVTAFGAGVYTWKMPKPLYLAPGQALNIDLINDVTDRGVVGAGAVSNVEVSVIGRSGSSADEPPDEVPLPFVTAWLEPWRTAAQLNGASDLLSNSGAADLNNPFPGPLFVKEFLGADFIDALNGGSYQVVDTPRLVGGGVHDDALIQIASALPTPPGAVPDTGRNKLVARDAIPFGLIFNALTRSWTVNSQLQTHGWYGIRLRVKGSSARPLPAAVSGRRHGVSMLGYHYVSSISVRLV